MQKITAKWVKLFEEAFSEPKKYDDNWCIVENSLEQFLATAIEQAIKEAEKKLIKKIRKLMEGHNFDIEYLTKIDEVLRCKK